MKEIYQIFEGKNYLHMKVSFSSMEPNPYKRHTYIQQVFSIEKSYTKEAKDRDWFLVHT